jgi:glycosyltransferase involved in cell wall biosynthesis
VSHNAAKQDSRPRVLVLTSTLPAREEDPEPRFVLDLCKHLARRFDMTVLAPGHPGARPDEKLEGIRVVRYRYAPFRNWETLAYPGAILPRLRSRPWLAPLVPLLLAAMRRRALKLVRDERFDCVHCHWLIPQGIVGRTLRRRAGLPYVVTSHGGDVFALRWSWARRRMRRVLEDSSGVTVVSTAIRDEIYRDPELAAARSSPVVIPMGVDLSRFEPALRDDAWVRAAGLSRPLVAFAGRLVEKKGLRYLIDAMTRDPLRTTNASLAVIGDGPLRRVLERQARDAGLGNRIRFLGPLPHSELARALASADVFCAPSVVEASGDREGLPTVICEASASGIPVVATRVSGIPEVVVDGTTGRLVAERDPAALSVAVAGLVADPDERSRMGQAARRHIEAFAWTESARRHGDMIEAAIAAAPARERRG